MADLGGPILWFLALPYNKRIKLLSFGKIGSTEKITHCPWSPFYRGNRARFREIELSRCRSIREERSPLSNCVRSG
jgi:hypothetical protein